ncbi:hypothetical protein DITRI_Ditri07aG0089500 [Diplodiscus trichospermus]
MLKVEASRDEAVRKVGVSEVEAKAPKRAKVLILLEDGSTIDIFQTEWRKQKTASEEGSGDVADHCLRLGRIKGSGHCLRRKRAGQKGSGERRRGPRGEWVITLVRGLDIPYPSEAPEPRPDSLLN